VTTKVIDASAILAILRAEKGAEVVQSYLRGALVSAVNYAEVMEQSLKREGGLAKARGLLSSYQVTLVPFDTEQAETVARLKYQIASTEISIADRACLALGLTRGVPVVTGDHLWADEDIGVKVILFRKRRMH
jgi:PIN domain nuclease of toxin-antitoxin system